MHFRVHLVHILPALSPASSESELRIGDDGFVKDGWGHDFYSSDYGLILQILLWAHRWLAAKRNAEIEHTDITTSHFSRSPTRLQDLRLSFSARIVLRCIHYSKSQFSYLWCSRQN